MIGVIFDYAGEVIEVRIIEDKVYFRTSKNPQFATIDGLKLDKSGVLKEHPDLRDQEDWQQQARDRFKEKVKEMKNEDERIKYVIEDLGKFGYKPMYLQKQGFRPVKI